MRVSAAILSALVAPSTALSLWSGDAQKGISPNEDLKIPGESPLKHCAGKKTDGYIEINSIDLSPNPPSAGKELVIKANGTVKKTIEEGAYIDLTVYYGLIRLLTTKADLCEQMGEVDLECPVEPGDRVITKTVELPKEIPPGNYRVVADVFTANGERITCLTASVEFSLGGFGGFGDSTGNEL
ncbi:hypothetical protein C2857_000443 [Epichloe festucae Fl1]|uniref:Phosphatidylglycerol/phosphatidylinositol transfer protein n=1 Tax=Epichloe festucae (strain Fl1) TaxID=877507 RepID=A0A7U3Q206_EPIFF|nr:hypothetical protein C2857_000443 [Epichloe festucae Fl1]